MIFRVQPGGKIQAFAHDGRPLGGQTAFHYLMFRATVSTPDGKTLFTKIPPSANGEAKKSDIRLLHMRQLMAQAAQGGLDHCFRLAVPRAPKAATVLVPCAFDKEGAGAEATHVRAPDGVVLPFASIRDARAAWHHLAVNCASASPRPHTKKKAPPPAAVAPPPAAVAPPPAAVALPAREADVPPPPPVTVFDPLPAVLPALPVPRPPPPPPAAAAEERVLRSRVVKRPRVA